MGSLSGFRLPHFSEDDGWLPAWLQQCNVQRLNLEDIKKDYITFEQRVEELQFLQNDISDGGSLREEGGCDIGQLFISGTDSSPFSFARSADNVVQLHLCLSSDGSEDTSLTTDVEAESDFPCVTQPIKKSGMSGQNDDKLSLSGNAGAVDRSPTAELKQPLDYNEFLKHDENVNFSEASADAAELCIAASEALVIKEVIESDSSTSSSSASAILEASLQVKHARLEVWKNTFSGSVHAINETDSLSDLDDITMESAYEDAGIHFNELPGNELSVSQVKDTFDSANDEKLKHEKTGASATIWRKICADRHTHRTEGVLDDDIQLKTDFPAKFLNGDSRIRGIDDPVCAVGTDIVYHHDCSTTAEAQAKHRPSVSAEKTYAITADNSAHETNVRSPPVKSLHDGEKRCSVPKMVQERFESRWFGGWTSKNDERYTAAKYIIPEPFAGETSFLSESADAAPDENSSVKNHFKENIVASQLSMQNENFTDRGKDRILLSQDERSSSTSLADVLCSVVPCSISENICSSPTINHENKVHPSPQGITTVCQKYNVLGTSPSNDALAQREEIATPIANIEETRNGVSRRFTSLRDYSKLVPRQAKFLHEDSHQKKLFLIDTNTELTFKDTSCTYCEETEQVEAEHPASEKEKSHSISPVVDRGTGHFSTSNCSTHNLSEKSPIQTSLLESKSKWLPIQTLQRALLQCKNRSAQKLPTSKRVRFSEKDANMPDHKELPKVGTASKKCRSTRTSKKSSRSSANPEPRAQQKDRFRKTRLDKEKKRLIFQGMEFFLTGFAQQKETEIECLIRKYGGTVLSQLPPINLKGKRSSKSTSRILPVVLCFKKIHSFKFLYGCAVNAQILKVNWLVDSIAAGVVLPTKEYMILSRNNGRRCDQVYTAANYDTHSLVFNNLGIMLHGKSKYFTNIATIIKHGGGQVFKTLQRLVQNVEAGRISKGVLVVDEEICASRHLKHCALEQNIPMTSVSWIIKSLYAGILIPLDEKKNNRPLPAVKLQTCQDAMELSQEI